MASSGYGLLVDKAYALKQEGLSIDALKKEVEKWRSRLHAYFFTSDLRFFIQGGRVSKAAGFIGGILKICPVLTITGEGTLKPIEKARGKKQAIENVLSKMEKGGYLPSEPCFLSHSACLEDAKPGRSDSGAIQAERQDGNLRYRRVHCLSHRPGNRGCLLLREGEGVVEA